MRSADPSKAEAVGGRIRFQAPRKRFKALRDEAATTSRHDTVALEPGWVDRRHVRIPSLREHAHRGGLQLAVSVHGAAATVFTLEEYNRRLEHETAHTAHLAAQSEAQWRVAQSQGPLPGSDSDGSD